MIVHFKNKIGTPEKFRISFKVWNYENGCLQFIFTKLKSMSEKMLFVQDPGTQLLSEWKLT
jgi:hypothetical protein